MSLAISGRTHVEFLRGREMLESLQLGVFGTREHLEALQLFMATIEKAQNRAGRWGTCEGNAYFDRAKDYPMRFVKAFSQNKLYKNTYLQINLLIIMKIFR